MNREEFELLTGALASPNATFVLGAGASAPAVPTIAQLPEALAQFSAHASSFPAAPQPATGLRLLLEPLLEAAATTSDMSTWKLGALTPGAIALALQTLITRSHFQALPQYQAFGLFPASASVVSFNWDGLARARCTQRVIIHPHGVVEPRLLSATAFANEFDSLQLLDTSSAREWIVPDLVLPGEEDSAALGTIKERIFRIWREASAAIAIGYSFGLRTKGLSYDSSWREHFVEAFRVNRLAPVHIVSPDALELRGEICELLGRHLNVYAWPLRWDLFAPLLLEIASDSQSSSIGAARMRSASMKSFTRKLALLSGDPA